MRLVQPAAVDECAHPGKWQPGDVRPKSAVELVAQDVVGGEFFVHLPQIG